MAGRRIAIAGGGIVGMTLALALKQALGESLDILLADPGLAAPPRADGRAYAVAAAPRRMLEALAVWPELAAAAEPMTTMAITDSRGADVVRPVFLTFGGDAEPGLPFAHMVESEVLARALLAACGRAGVTLLPQGVAAYRPQRREVALADGKALGAELLVAADGARSRLREQAGIGWVGWSYRQSGIVATLSHPRPHGGRAVENFLPAGPFALLPLVDGGLLGHRSSIVWTEPSENLPALLALDEADLTAEIEKRFGLELGELALETPIRSYPLAYGIARRFYAERLALLGDAAHVVHPIAGQGLNLGLKDVAALAEVLVDAARSGLDLGSQEVLSGYEQARRFDTVTMGAAMDGLNRLFSNDATPLRLARDLGLGLVDRLPELKRFFIREASGLAGRPPRLLRGEAL